MLAPYGMLMPVLGPRAVPEAKPDKLARLPRHEPARP
jgi:hypothetical protein